jgi:hypothetical protein
MSKDRKTKPTMGKTMKSPTKKAMRSPVAQAFSDSAASDLTVKQKKDNLLRGGWISGGVSIGSVGMS